MKKTMLIFFSMTLFWVSCGMLPSSVEKLGVKIQYGKDISKEEADALLTYLIDGGFADGNQKDLKLAKNGDGYTVKMVIKDDYPLDAGNMELMQDFACEVSKGAFKDKKVTLELCDDSWGVKKSLVSENCDQFELLDKKSRKFRGVELFYSDNMKTEEVDAVEAYLKDELTDNVERTFALDHLDGKGIFSMVILDKSTYDDAEMMDSFRALACDIQKILGYETVVHLCDKYMKMEQVVNAEKCN